MAEELRCECGHVAEDVLELATCAQCGTEICLQCAQIDQKTCQMYCYVCAGKKSAAKKTAKPAGHKHKTKAE